ncbi:MAG: PP2C family protein-serine/threonine phosphatase [Acidimicrobiia bacterium]
MTYLWAAATHRGRTRASNQDALHPEGGGRSDGPLLVMVADGMGGHVGGEVASRLAVERAVEADGGVASRVVAGNRAIIEEVDRRPKLAGMGTTMTLVELGVDRVARFGHVGDSRAYLLRHGQLVQLTEDHTVVAEYVQAGKIRPEDIPSHPQRSMLTRALGLNDDLPVDTFQEPLQPGDRLLLCSDGVSSMIPDDDIRQVLCDGTPEEAVWALIERANRAGGHDNITSIVVHVVS